MSFNWKVYYKDQTVLSQFNLDGSENLFSDIDFSSLDVFVLEFDDKPFFQVNVPLGVFSLGGRVVRFGSFDSNRLIYFRRNTRVISASNTSMSSSVQHVVGLQATVDGVNRKLMFGVDDVSGGLSVVFD